MTNQIQAEAEAPVDATTPVLAPEEATPEVAEPVEGDPTPAQDEAAKAEEAHRKGLSARERVQQAVARQREAEREAAMWRERALAPSQAAEGEPDPEAYDGGQLDPKYIRDLINFQADSAVRQALSATAQQSVFRAGYQGFEAKIAQDYPDGVPAGITALGKREAEIVNPIVEMLFALDNGHKVADHLGANPEALDRLAALPVYSQAIELAKLDAKLSVPAPEGVKPKTVTEAPAPAPQVRAPGGQFKVAADTNDFAAFERQYRPT